MTEERGQHPDDPHKWITSQFHDDADDADDADAADAARPHRAAVDDEDADDPGDVAGPVPPRSATGRSQSGFVWGLRPNPSLEDDPDSESAEPVSDDEPEIDDPTNPEPTNTQPTNAQPTNAQPTNAQPTEPSLREAIVDAPPPTSEPVDASHDGPPPTADPVASSPAEEFTDIPTLEQVLDAPSPRRAAREAAAKEAAAREAAERSADSTAPSVPPAAPSVPRAAPQPNHAVPASATDSAVGDTGFSLAEPPVAPGASGGDPEQVTDVETAEPTVQERRAPLFAEPEGTDDAVASPSRTRVPMSSRQRVLFIVIAAIIVVAVVLVVLLLTGTIGGASAARMGTSGLLSAAGATRGVAG